MANRSRIPFWYADQLPGYVPDPDAKPGVRKRVRRKDIAEAFGVDIRTIDGWAKRGVIAAPHYLEAS